MWTHQMQYSVCCFYVIYHLIKCIYKKVYASACFYLQIRHTCYTFSTLSIAYNSL